MPLDASDRTRRVQEITTFQGWAAQQNKIQPLVNISTCTIFNHSQTIKQFPNYAIAQLVESGQPLFSTCVATHGST